MLFGFQDSQNRTCVCMLKVSAYLWLYSDIMLGQMFKSLPVLSCPKIQATG